MVQLTEAPAEPAAARGGRAGGFLAGQRVLIVSGRDVLHPQAGAPERYLYEIARRWVAWGADVTWAAGRPAGASAGEPMAGITVLRLGGRLGTYPATLAFLLRRGRRFDAVVDGAGRVLLPAAAGWSTPVVRVVFGGSPRGDPDRFPAAALRRLQARWRYGHRPVVALSASSRHALRRQLRLRGPIHVVPAGTAAVPGEIGYREVDPTIVVIAPPAREHRLDGLLGVLAGVVEQVPRLQVEVIGAGPEQARLRRQADEAGLAATVTVHGPQTEPVRQAWLAGAWLTVSVAVADSCGGTVLEAAAWGVPCVGLSGSGSCDFVLPGQTGTLVDSLPDLGPALVDQLTRLADGGYARTVGAACRAWAGCFRWERSAALLARVVAGQRPATAGSARATASDPSRNISPRRWNPAYRTVTEPAGSPPG